MLVDPFTVIAQIVNFALLVWLLRRFLYGPVTRAMQAREARVREEVEAARRLHAEAEAEGKRYRALLADLEKTREARLMEVRAEAEALRQEQVRELRAEMKELRARWQRALEQEQEAFLQGLRTRVGQELLAVMRRALKEMADEALEDRLVHRFVDRLRGLKAEDRERLAAAIREDEIVQLRTAFPLSDAHRAALHDALAETLGVEAALRFETNADLIAGVELQAGGVKVAWTIDDYLHSLEDAVREVFPETADAEGLHDNR